MAIAAVGVIAALVGAVLLAAQPVATLGVVLSALVVREAVRHRETATVERTRRPRPATEARATPR